MTTPAPAPFGGSDRQRSFITNLLETRKINADATEPIGAIVVAALNVARTQTEHAAQTCPTEFTIDHYLGGVKTKAEASRLIDYLLSLPKWAAPAPVVTVAPTASPAPAPAVVDQVDPPLGVHEYDGNVYRVVKARETDRRYAKRLTATNDWEYVGRNPFRVLSDSTLMPYERAVEIGQTGDWCIFGHPLEDPLSCVRGLGPTCESRNFPDAPPRTAAAKRAAAEAVQTEAGKAAARAEFLAAISTKVGA